MSLFRQAAQSWKKDWETMKGLTLRKKIGFVADYYRGYLFLLLCLFLLLFYLGDLVYQSRQIIDLQGFFINDRQNRFPADDLSRDFSSWAGTARGHRIAFEDSLFVDLDSDNQYSAASQGKIVAYTAAHQLDFLIAPAELAEYYAKSFPAFDLELLLPQDLLRELSGDLCFLTDNSGAKKACCLNLRHSIFFADPAYDGTEDYYLLVLGYTERTEAVTAFLEYAYQRQKPAQ